MIGKQLLHYEITEKLGEGGMGVVYKARDTHLGRFVAIKVLPPERISDPSRKARFVQEAKAASSLNHPNIVTIYDIGSDGGRDYIAMEYVAGKVLDELIPRKGMRVRDALKIAVQISDALTRAHAAGIVHRDLKPANIMVDEHGLVKLLDFGLAKLTEQEVDEFAPTETLKPQTGEGTVVGTAGYMSPEQVEGKRVDARSDIFSFGCVLYEIVTGQRAFRGDSKMSTLSAILHQEPAPIRDTPPELEKLIARCLRKDPERRAQHMADLKLALEELKEESESGTLIGSGAVRPRPSSRGAWIKAAGIATFVVGSVLAIWYLRPPAAPPAPLKRLTSDTGLTTDPALSPDGRLAAYASDRAGGENLDIWVQQVDGGGAPLRLTNDPTDESEPCFSPDGNQIAFRSERDGGGIYIIPALGGEPRLIVKGGRQPRFSPDGSRIAFIGARGGAGGIVGGELYVTPLIGPAPQRLVGFPLSASYPVWSPDGKLILFATGAYRPDDWGIVPSEVGKGSAPLTLSLADMKKKLGLADVLPWAWIEGNVILFSARAGDSSHIFETDLSPPSLISRTWKLAASPKRLTAGTEIAERPALASSPSQSGRRRLAFAGTTRSEHLWSLALDTARPGTTGKLQHLTEGSGFHLFPSISEDGTKLAYIAHSAYNDEVWIMDRRSGKRVLLTTETSVKFKPVITRDGSRVMYGTSENGTSCIFAIAAAGGERQKLCEGCGWPWDWSIDGKRIFGIHFYKESVTGEIVNLATSKHTLFSDQPGTQLYQFHWSPDGRWIVFLVTQGGQSILHIAPIAGDTEPAKTTWMPIPDESNWADKPNWSPDGNWIYGLSARDGHTCIWACPLNPATKSPSGKPVAVFHSHSARQSLRNANLVSQELSVARDRIVFNQGEITGNIWMTEREP